MGGKKKLSLKQMERMQDKSPAPKKEKEGKEGKAGSGGSAPDKKVAGITMPDLKSDKLINEIKKLKVLTPYTVASRFELRLSVARDVLEELEQRGVVQFVSSSRNTKIYKPVD
jgi:small subunit ribosomal protein S25e